MKAAIEGRVIILDGVDRLIPSTFTIIQRLCQDRELSLFDNTKLMRREKIELIHSSSSDIQSAKLIAIHPSFRIIAIGNNPSMSNQWLTSEVISMFHFHYLRSLTVEEKCDLIFHLFPSLRGIQSWIEELLRLQDDDSHRNPQLLNSSSSSSLFSVREIIRICKKLNSYSEYTRRLPNLQTFQFIPNISKSYQILQLITRQMNKVDSPSSPQVDNNNGGVVNEGVDEEIPSITIQSIQRGGNEYLVIGDIEYKKEVPTDPALIPHVNFFNIPSHLIILKNMLHDYILGGFYFIHTTHNQPFSF